MSVIPARPNLVPRVAAETSPISLNAVVQDLHLRRPVRLRDLLALLQPIRLVFALRAGSCSGSCELTMTSDGVVRFAGHVRDSGPLAVKYAVITSFPVSAPGGGPLLVIEHQGHAAGTFAFGSRSDGWDATETDPVIAARWTSVRAVAPSATTQFGTDAAGFEALQAIVATASGGWILHL